MKNVVLRRFEGVAYRATTYDTPLWVFPNRRPGRWGTSEDKEIIQYCSLDPSAPLAEFVRDQNLDLKTAAEARIGLWELRVEQSAVLDLSSRETAEAVSVDWDELVAEDWSKCHEISREALAEGAQGIIAPSAALPGSLTLVLFGPRSELAWERQTTLSIQVPARKLMTGAPEIGVIRATRRRGEEFPKEIKCSSIAHMLKS